MSDLALASQASTMDLHDACENGNKYLIKKKLENGDWKVTDRDETGRTGLHAACFGAQLDVVKLLFGYKVPMDVGDGGRKKKETEEKKTVIQYMGSNQSNNDITYEDLSEPVCLGQNLETGEVTSRYETKLWSKRAC